MIVLPTRFVAEFVGTLPINILERSDLDSNKRLDDWIKTDLGGRVA